MAVAWGWSNYSSGTTGPASLGTSLTVGVSDAGGSNGALAAGDIAIVTVTVGQSGGADPGTISLTGFTQLQSLYNSRAGSRTTLFARNIQAGDTASWTASWTPTATLQSWSLTIITGGDYATLVSASNQDTVPFVTSLVAPSVTPPDAASLLLCLWTNDNGTITQPSSPFTARFSNNSNSGTRPHQVGGTEQLSSGSATGTRTATCSLSTAEWNGYSVAIKSAASAATGYINVPTLGAG